MFCSNCGKSIRPEDASCPHCGAVLGEDRFLGNMYTSSQVHLPVDALDRAPAGSLSAYTRTDYMSYDNQPEDDVYSNTTYRPLLDDEEDLTRQEEAAQPEERDGDDGEYAPEPEEGGAAPEPERSGTEPLDELEAVADSFAGAEDDDDEETSVSPLPEIRPRGISPAVQRYMREAEARHQNQAQRGGGLKVRLPFFKRQPAPEPEEYEEEPAEDIPGAAEPEETAQNDAYEPEAAHEESGDYAESDPYEEAGPAEEEAEDAPAGETDEALSADEDSGYEEDDGYEEEAGGYEEETGGEEEEGDEESSSSKFKFDLSALKNNRKLQIAIAVVLVLAVLIGGVRWLLFVTSSLGTKIAGVTHSTYSEGIKLIEEYTSDEYRSNWVDVAASRMDYAKLTMGENMDKLNALMPKEPQKNDDLFVTALTIIYDGVQNVIIKDAEAVANGTQTERETASQQEWAVIQNAVSQLKNATAETQLSTLITDVQNGVLPKPTTAPTPVASTSTPAPTPVVYKEGVKDNDEVKRMQQRLIDLGYLTGKADGDFGPKTGAALKAFQTAAGLTADGIASDEVLSALYAEDAPAAAPTNAPDQAVLTVTEV